MKNTKEITDRLLYAKDAVRYCLDEPMGAVDMKGLKYWAGEVERLRNELKEVM